MEDSQGVRWSDEKLQTFYEEHRLFIEKFMLHTVEVEQQRQQQKEMYDVLFRLEDRPRNIAPGLVQLVTTTADDVKTLRIAADRQKTFVGGVLFAVTSVWFFVTDIGPLLLEKLKKIS